MRVTLAAVTPRRGRLKSPHVQQLIDDYIARSAQYCPVELRLFATEEELLTHAEGAASRSKPHMILLDSRGKTLTSEQMAAAVLRQRDAGTQHMMLAIGPASGWSTAAHARANLLLSLGAITLPHELALLVASEQLYRALTIIAGHPYHSSH